MKDEEQNDENENQEEIIWLSYTLLFWKYENR